MDAYLEWWVEYITLNDIVTGILVFLTKANTKLLRDGDTIAIDGTFRDRSINWSQSTFWVVELMLLFDVRQNYRPVSDVAISHLTESSQSN